MRKQEVGGVSELALGLIGDKGHVDLPPAPHTAPPWIVSQCILLRPIVESHALPSVMDSLWDSVSQQDTICTSDRTALCSYLLYLEPKAPTGHKPS